MWPASEPAAVWLEGPSSLVRVTILSSPAEAARRPDGDSAQVITHAERSGTEWALVACAAFQTFRLPSCETLMSVEGSAGDQHRE